MSASDVSFRMVDFARRNAERAGVAHVITFNGGDALERPAPSLAPELPGTLMLNPPYGERIEPKGAASAAPRDGDESPGAGPTTPFRARTANCRATSIRAWQRTGSAPTPRIPAGWTAWVLSPDMKLPGAMRLKESRRVPMWNGPIECRLFRFDLVAGSARPGATKKPEPASGGALQRRAAVRREPQQRQRRSGRPARASRD